MKKIIFYVVKNSNDDPNKIFELENNNSCLSYSNNKYWFNRSSTLPPEEIDVRFENIIFDSETYDEFCLILKNAKKEACKITTQEPIECEYQEGSLEGVISSSINKAYYENPNSIFSFVGDIFIKILMGHKLRNGNKRVALLFLIIVLRKLGYHFNWSKGIRQNYSFYKTQVEKFVENLQNAYNDLNNSSKKESAKSEIFNWIKRKSVIALEWR